MMQLLSGLFGVVTGGPLLTWLIYPLVGVLTLTGGHMLIENWKGNLRSQGERTCDARWEKQIREEEQLAARYQLDASRSLLETERQTSGALNDKLKTLSEEMEAVRFSGIGGGDDRCLSSGVLEFLERQDGAGTESQPVRKRREKSGAAKRPADTQ